MTVYLRREQAQTGKVTFTEHWVWNRELFLQTQQSAQRMLANEGKEWEIIGTATSDEYRAFAWKDK